MQVFKTVQQSYIPPSEVLKLIADYRLMVNESIRLALENNLTSRNAICKKMFNTLSNYPYATDYRLTAIGVACGLLKNYRKALRDKEDVKQPYLTQQFAKIIRIRVIDGKLRLPIYGHRTFVWIPLSGYTLRAISGYSVRSAVLTACTLSISFSKEIAIAEPSGLIGLDRNLDNVTSANLKGETKVYNLSKATEIKAKYREVKRHLRRNDARIRQNIFRKYGKLQRNRVNQILHNVSKAIVADAKSSSSGIVMEDLTGIRKMYRKGNGQGKNHRAKMNIWSFYELQRQIEYKAKWVGIKVIYVYPAKTSSTCAICGGPVTECTERKVWCHRCMKLMDRDENAALNIVMKGLIPKPVGLASEVMGKERSKGLILLADASQDHKRLVCESRKNRI